jgi:[methyl-Co(III) methanol-specific corrinoid protein]:coenzyme M methyltransferase
MEKQRQKGAERMIERMEESNPLVRLIKKFQKGARPVTLMGPFLPLVRLKERGLPFNDTLRDSQAMTEAALMSFEFGFESTVLPFDLNVEAEILGARVRYHDGFDGNPVYPTIADKPFTPEDDIEIPDALAEKGRMPAILKTIGTLKERARDKGAVGVFIPGPFTLAGQVLDLDALHPMLLKQPEKTLRLFGQLTTFINQLIDLYVRAGADFMIVVEGGGASIAPKTFRKLLLPSIQEILKPKKMPQVTFFFGNSREIIEFMLACDPDGILLDKECDIEKTRGLIPEAIPLFGECGSFDMLAKATPAEITDKVHRCLDLGFTTVCPPADVYPPAKINNIEAFVTALQEYGK